MLEYLNKKQHIYISGIHENTSTDTAVIALYSLFFSCLQNLHYHSLDCVIHVVLKGFHVFLLRLSQNLHIGCYGNSELLFDAKKRRRKMSNIYKYTFKTYVT